MNRRDFLKIIPAKTGDNIKSDYCWNIIPSSSDELEFSYLPPKKVFNANGELIYEYPGIVVVNKRNK